MSTPPRATSGARNRFLLVTNVLNHLGDHDLETGRLGNGQPLAVGDLVPPSHGLMSVRPQPAKPSVSCVTTAARAAKAVAAINASNVWIGAPA